MHNWKLIGVYFSRNIWISLCFYEVFKSTTFDILINIALWFDKPWWVMAVPVGYTAFFGIKGIFSVVVQWKASAGVCLGCCIDCFIHPSEYQINHSSLLDMIFLSIWLARRFVDWDISFSPTGSCTWHLGFGEVALSPWIILATLCEDILVASTCASSPFSNGQEVQGPCSSSENK